MTSDNANLFSLLTFAHKCHLSNHVYEIRTPMTYVCKSLLKIDINYTSVSWNLSSVVGTDKSIFGYKLTCYLRFHFQYFPNMFRLILLAVVAVSLVAAQSTFICIYLKIFCLENFHDKF